MKQPVRRQFDPVLVDSGAPDATVVNGPCPCHGDAVVRFCMVVTQDLQPALVVIAEQLVCLS